MRAPQSRHLCGVLRFFNAKKMQVIFFTEAGVQIDVVNSVHERGVFFDQILNGDGLSLWSVATIKRTAGILVLPSDASKHIFFTTNQVRQAGLEKKLCL